MPVVFLLGRRERKGMFFPKWHTKHNYSLYMDLKTGVLKATFYSSPPPTYDSWKSGGLNQTKTVPLKWKFTSSFQDYGPSTWGGKKKVRTDNVEDRQHHLETTRSRLQGTSQQGFKYRLKLIHFPQRPYTSTVNFKWGIRTRLQPD